MRFLRQDRSLPFCPGCGHGRIVTALDGALERLGRDPRRVVIVSDIGCVGLCDQYFSTHGFHGLHGRSVTYAAGLRLADPELTVIVLIGDGGCGIGGTHLVNAARRNVGITVLVFNNFNFGMTGGEHSVTTPAGALTTTTLAGNIERPLDICGLVMAGGVGWVGRSTIYDQQLGELIAEAIAFDGFALLDIWDLCTAYYGRVNRLGPKAMAEMAATLGFSMGVLQKVPGEEWLDAYRRRAAAGPPAARIRDLTPEFLPGPAGRSRRLEIVLAGSAGQKVRSAATALGTAAILSGLHATQKDDYPITVMTGHSVSEVIVSQEEVGFTGIVAPDAAVILSPEGQVRTAARVQRMRPGGLVLIDDQLPRPETPARVLSLPLRATAATIQRHALAPLALGSLVGATGLLLPEALSRAFSLLQDPSTAAGSQRALAAGIALTHPSGP
ncbi:MAG: 2-oxoacid:acceptor oxidoreductase family protein [Deltaproteobacteria bacterium]|nr:2-oxoacid:acceptor oxidoreductase family protein [Deltaproteobacteria bacterium]